MASLMTWKHGAIYLGCIAVGLIIFYVSMVNKYTIVQCPICTDSNANLQEARREIQTALNSTDSHSAEHSATKPIEEILNSINYPPDSKHMLTKWLLSWQQEIREEINELIEEKVSDDDPRLIKHIRKVLVPPASHKMIKYSRGPMKTPQVNEVINVLKGKKNGFFIEAGALDGERSSNTLYLEAEYGWTGLLVEMDPFFYTQIMGRNRRSHSINACLSPERHPLQLAFSESGKGSGKLNTKANLERAPNAAVCYPLYSILLAMNVTKVDFFSLDVEGFEMPILKTIPWEKIDISVLAVEYVHGDKSSYSDYMKDKGYKVHKDIHHHVPSQTLYVDDFIFVKN